MKTRIVTLFTVLVMLFALTACSPSRTGVTVSVAAIKGPTAIGLVQLMDSETTRNEYDFTLAGSPDEVTGGVVTGGFDVAFLPSNLAATLYNKTDGAIQIIALVTKGVLYVVTTRDDISSLDDLSGKTVLSSGKGSNAEYVFNYLLTQAGISDVTVDFVGEHTEVAAALAAGTYDIAVLPQPFVSSVLLQNEDASIAVDLTEVWNTATDGESELIMSAVVAQKSFIEEQPEALKAFLDEYKASVEYVTNPDNLATVAASVAAHGIIPAENVAKTAIPKCNITFISGADMKPALSAYLEVMFEANPQAVGGKLPDDGIWYDS